jgi:hypothetical protein
MGSLGKRLDYGTLDSLGRFTYQTRSKPVGWSGHFKQLAGATPVWYGADYRILGDATLAI